jgi:hypothetical protein
MLNFITFVAVLVSALLLTMFTVAITYWSIVGTDDKTTKIISAVCFIITISVWYRIITSISLTI